MKLFGKRKEVIIKKGMIQFLEYQCPKCGTWNSQSFEDFYKTVKNVKFDKKDKLSMELKCCGYEHHFTAEEINKIGYTPFEIIR